MNTNAIIARESVTVSSGRDAVDVNVSVFLDGEAMLTIGSGRLQAYVHLKEDDLPALGLAIANAMLRARLERDRLGSAPTPEGPTP